MRESNRTLLRLTWHNNLTWFVLLSLSLISLTMIFLLISILFRQSLAFFENVSLREFFTQTQWTPLFDEPRFGIWPLLSGTLTITLIALFVAAPLGFLIAIYFSEISSQRMKNLFRPLLDILAGIPTIILGFVGLFYLTPFLKKLLPGLQSFNKLSAGVMVGVLLIPYIASLLEEGFATTPKELREGSLALGASLWNTVIQVFIPHHRSLIIATLLLAIARAVGETMIVVIVAGALPTMSWNPLEGGQTMTGFIASVSMGDAPHGSLGYQAMYAVGFALSLLTLALNFMSIRFRGKR